MTANGSFDVKMLPAPLAGESPIGSLALDKTFRGDLEATSKGHMLAFNTRVKGSAGYVAMEQVTGSLGGRTGTFVLQHSGPMTRGEPRLTLMVVPDSGTDELEGLSGSMEIIVEGGRHSYVFEYEISEAE
jgi:hypothetical protein